MIPSDEFYIASENDSLNIRDWINQLHTNYPKRSLSHGQTHQFYFRRRLVEYSVKTTISASLAVALIWGAPPVWIIGGAALMLRFSTYVLNHFNPSQYQEESEYQAKLRPGELIENKKLEEFRLKWRQDNKNYIFSEHINTVYTLQKRIAFALIAGFVIFTVLNTGITIPIIVASLLYADSLIRQATEQLPPYLEKEDELLNLYAPQP